MCLPMLTPCRYLSLLVLCNLFPDGDNSIAMITELSILKGESNRQEKESEKEDKVGKEKEEQEEEKVEMFQE